MKIYKELEQAIQEETQALQETKEFSGRFAKLLENYLDGMGADSEIADVINLVTLGGEQDEN